MEPKQKITLDISAVSVVKIILICLLFVFLFLERDVILIVLAAVVIASAIEPGTIWFAKRNVKRVFSVVIIYLSLGLIFVGGVFFFLPQFLGEVSSFVGTISDYLNIAASPSGAQGTGLIGNSGLFEQLSFSFLTVKDIIGSFSSSFSDSSQGLLESIRLIFGGIFSFILIVVLSFYLAVQEDGIADFLRIITPLRYEKQVISLWKRSQHKIGLWMQGQVLLGVIVGVLVYIGLKIFGVPHALLLAVIAALFEIIPVFGPILSAIPGVLIASGVGGIPFALGIAVMYIIIQQLENHFVYPLVVKKIVGVSPIVVILALVIGAKLGGILGILLSVPVSAALMEYFNDIQKDKETEEPTSSALIL